jgi:CYTH domain-containing protein
MSLARHFLVPGAGWAQAADTEVMRVQVTVTPGYACFTLPPVARLSLLKKNVVRIRYLAVHGVLEIKGTFVTVSTHVARG